MFEKYFLQDMRECCFKYALGKRRSDKIMREWEKNIRKVTPYVPGEQPKQKNVIKLNTNENPYPPSPKVTAALQALETDPLRKYPDPAAQQLTDRKSVV